MILTNYFIKRRIDGLLSSVTRTRRFKTIDEINTVLLLYHVSDSKEVETCISRLKAMGKMVYTCGYKAEEAPQSPSGEEKDDDTHIYIRHKQDVNLWGMPAEAVLEKINACRPDVVIDLTRSKNCVMQYLLLKCDCNFKAGIKNGERDLYDFSISAVENKDLTYLFEQIIFYLQTIRSK